MTSTAGGARTRAECEHCGEMHFRGSGRWRECQRSIRGRAGGATGQVSATPPPTDPAPASHVTRPGRFSGCDLDVFSIEVDDESRMHNSFVAAHSVTVRDSFIDGAEIDMTDPSGETHPALLDGAVIGPDARARLYFRSVSDARGDLQAQFGAEAMIEDGPIGDGHVGYLVYPTHDGIGVSLSYPGRPGWRTGTKRLRFDDPELSGTDAHNAPLRLAAEASRKSRAAYAEKAGETLADLAAARPGLGEVTGEGQWEGHGFLARCPGGQVSVVPTAGAPGDLQGAASSLASRMAINPDRVRYGRYSVDTSDPSEPKINGKPRSLR